MVSALTIDAAVLVEGYGRLRLGAGTAFDSIMVSVWSRKIMIVGHAGHRIGVRKTHKFKYLKRKFGDYDPLD